MNLFLTGITGFCGSLISRRLLRMGHSVWALSRRGLTAELLSFTREMPGLLTIVDADLASLEELPQSIHGVIHAAAVSPTSACRTSDFIQHNILGTQRLLRLALAGGVRKFIFFSSLSLYGDIRTPVARENTPIVNPGPYGISKLLCEFLLRDQPPELSSIALRLPAVLGHGATRHWLATTAQRAKNGKDIHIFNPEARFNNAVHVEDLADLIEDLLGRSWTGFDAITLGADGSLSIAEIATRVLAATGTNARIIVEPAQQPCFTVSSERAKTLYGYKPMDFETMLTRYLSEV